MRVTPNIKSIVLDSVRRREPTVLWPLDDFGIGNILYFWLQAWVRNEQGERVVVRETDAMKAWEKWFPAAFESLIIESEDLSFFSRREVGETYQGFGEHFSVGQLADFVESMLLGRSAFSRLVSDTDPNADLTVNVRRGDYYSVPKFRGRYSFDVVEYVRTALTEVALDGAVRNIRIVSDDPDWCRLKLGWLEEHAKVTFPEPGAPVALQLALLATSPRLILTNSTLSYWGGYLSTHVSRGEPSRVWAPWFHGRDWNGGAAYQLHPSWRVVRDIPGGWDG